MALLQNSFEGQTNGTSATGTNSANSGTALAFNRGTGSTTVYSNAHPGHGSIGLLLASGASAACSAVFNGISTPSLAVRRYFYTDALPTATVGVLGVGTVSAYITSTGAVQVNNASGSAVFTSSVQLSANTQYRFELWVQSGTTTSNGVINFAVYLGGATTAVTGTTYTSSTANTGTTNLVTATYGRAAAGTASAWNDYLDEPAAQDSATGFIGTAANNTPTVDAGADQSVEPFSTVTLTATGSDTDGTIASYAWTQTSGTGVTLSGTGASRTFTAPAAQSSQVLVFSVTCTDDGGATSSPDTVTVTVLPATEFYLSSGGVWQPLQTIEL